MNIYKFIFYIHILGICLPVTLTYIFFFEVFTGQSIRPISIIIMALGYAVMVKMNPVFHYLWEKWTDDGKRKK
ncbi:hypothetical protein [Sporosarcina sp. HYO08]|uniref:hypothetical protein n=1 Tax=Sporosarcina sp. HYO08 TaxID=1759557 RepID=UPI0007960C00|nr:hypothetical protein [Sporosarcina sp. HYO08]KXH81730.1 hypothetical protein AU377_05550 [Sporosarcina sp. HYO08]